MSCKNGYVLARVRQVLGPEIKERKVRRKLKYKLESKREERRDYRNKQRRSGIDGISTRKYDDN